MASGLAGRESRQRRRGKAQDVSLAYLPRTRLRRRCLAISVFARASPYNSRFKFGSIPTLRLQDLDPRCSALIVQAPAPAFSRAPDRSSGRPKIETVTRSEYAVMLSRAGQAALRLARGSYSRNVLHSGWAQLRLTGRYVFRVCVATDALDNPRPVTPCRCGTRK